MKKSRIISIHVNGITTTTITKVEELMLFKLLQGISKILLRISK